MVTKVSAAEMLFTKNGVDEWIRFYCFRTELKMLLTLERPENQNKKKTKHLNVMQIC